MRIVGLMSGTSADGIDAVVARIEGAPPAIGFTVESAVILPFPAELQWRIHAAGRTAGADADAICRLNAELGAWFAEAALAAIAAAGRTPGEVDLIASHGQTIRHSVDPDGRVAGTLQIGEPAVIAERTGVTTIAGFRTRDVAAGGQGAPLVSMLDWLLLRDATRRRAVLNIGGIGNVTILPPLDDPNGRPIAFDTGPGNALTDALVTALSAGAERYDADGRRALAGRVDEAWLAELLADPWFAAPPPRTTGRERFGPELADRLLRTGRKRGLGEADIVATVTALTAAAVADACRRFAPGPVGEVIVSGGGARNPAMLAGLRDRFPPGTDVHPIERLGIASEQKEALAFAVIAHETWHARPWSVPELTGVRHPVILGSITPGANLAALVRRTWCGPG